MLFNELLSFVFHSYMRCCYFAEFYQVGKDDKLHIYESPAEYKLPSNAFFFLKHKQKEGLS